jgi:hypothetical protein
MYFLSRNSGREPPGVDTRGLFKRSTPGGSLPLLRVSASQKVELASFSWKGKLVQPLCKMMLRIVFKYSEVKPNF